MFSKEFEMIVRVGVSSGALRRLSRGPVGGGNARWSQKSDRTYLVRFRSLVTSPPFHIPGAVYSRFAFEIYNTGNAVHEAAVHGTRSRNSVHLFSLRCIHLEFTLLSASEFIIVPENVGRAACINVTRYLGFIRCLFQTRTCKRIHIFFNAYFPPFFSLSLFVYLSTNFAYRFIIVPRCRANFNSRNNVCLTPLSNSYREKWWFVVTCNFIRYVCPDLSSNSVDRTEFAILFTELAPAATEDNFWKSINMLIYFSRV